MRTGRSLTVCCSMLPGEGVLGPGGGCLVQGGCLLRGCLLLWGGVCSRGVPAPGGWGVCSRGGACSWGGGVSALGGCLLPGDLFRGGLLLGGSPCLGGFSLPRGVLPARGGSPCPETPPVNRITDTCKNITLATTSLRPVKINNKCISQCLLNRTLAEEGLHWFIPVLAHLHCRRWTWVQTRIQIQNLMTTLYYAGHVHIAQTWTPIPTHYFCKGQESWVLVRTGVRLWQCKWAIPFTPNVSSDA